VALGAHYRLALPAVKVGLPEVDLGLMPGAGGTQRAPRLMGVKAAAEFMLSGKPIGAQAAVQAGLIEASWTPRMLVQAMGPATATAPRWTPVWPMPTNCWHRQRVRPCAVCATSPSLTPKPRWPS
jgi:enoyl-CoA hydratase/carnithine racemase